METDTQGKENMHVMEVPTSPSFLKPKPIKLRKRTAHGKIPLPLNEVDINKANNEILKELVDIPKNPFRRREGKRKRELETEDDDSNSLLWRHVNRVFENTSEKKVSPSPVVPSMLDECALSSFSDTVFSCAEKREKASEKILIKDLPVDWSLKTKIRFTSSTPFPSRGSFRTFEEVNGTIGFVRCLHPNETEKSDVHSSHGARFFQNCLVWMHPSLPWLNLFPRINNRIQKASSSSVIDSAAQEILHSKWCDSFRSLFQLVRLYQCPYFYMCTATFTVLFRCAGTASIPVIHALISPTTKGFRKALREEGITFSMPLCQTKESESSSDDPCDSTNVNNTDDIEDSPEITDTEEKLDEDEEPESWLESLGLSQDNFPSLNKKKRRDDLAFMIDHKPESLVYIEDSETQALVNFLLNSDFCMDKLGPLAGVPPTLLAPTAFLGGTLQSLQIRNGRVKQDDQELHSVEVSGPLMPNTVHTLCSLFGGTQDGEFCALLSQHKPTNAFSMVKPHSPALPCLFAKNNMADCGLADSFVQQMCSTPSDRVVCELKMEKGLYVKEE